MIYPDTFLLTSEGWKTIQSMTKKDYLFSIGRDDYLGMLPITKITRHKYSGELYKVRESFISENTYLPVKNVKKRNLQKIKNIKTYSNITTPEYYYEGNKLNPMVFMDNVFDMGLILKLTGYFLECGRLNMRNQAKEIIFHNRESVSYRITDLLDQLGLVHSETETKIGIDITVKGPLMYYFFFNQFYTKHNNKFIPRSILNLDKRYLRYLLNGYIDSSGPDGNYLDNSFKIISKTQRPVLKTKDLVLIDDIHELIIKCGYLFNTFIIKTDPMRRVNYNSLEKHINPFLEVRIVKNMKSEIEVNEVEKTLMYDIDVDCKFFLIANQSKPLWVRLMNR